MKHLAALVVAAAIFALALVRYSAERRSERHRTPVSRSAATVSSESPQFAPGPLTHCAPLSEVRKRQIPDLAREIEERADSPTGHAAAQDRWEGLGASPLGSTLEGAEERAGRESESSLRRSAHRPRVRPPSIHFGAADKKALAVRCRNDTRTWPRLLEHAEALLVPGAVDPTTVAQGGENLPMSVRGHVIGKRLTDWLETLGFAWQVTGDNRYADLGTRILLEAAQRLAPDREPLGLTTMPGARADVLHALTSGYDWLHDALGEVARAQVANALCAFIANLLDEAEQPDCWWRSGNNFSGVAGGAAGRAALAVADRFPREAAHWRNRAMAIVRDYFETAFDEGGACIEGVTYAVYGLENAIRFADALARTGRRHLMAHGRLRHVPRFYAQSLLPGETVFDALNDSDYAGIRTATLLRLAGEGDGLAKWLWENTGGAAEASPWNLIWANRTEPVPPAAAGLPWAQHFRGRGLVVFRTGWSAQDLMLSMESGPYHWVNHDQADKGQVTLYGASGRWMIDSGYGNTQTPEGLAQTVAHNLILVDGRGQAIAGQSLGSDGAIRGFRATETHGWALSDATSAYRRNSRGDPGVKLESALRQVVFARPCGDRPAYAVIVDSLKVDGKTHAFDWLLHTSADNQVTTGASEAVLRSHPTASGGRYVEAPERDRGEIRFLVTLENAGRYRVWARARAGRPNPQGANSFFVQWDAQEPVTWHLHPETAWSWTLHGEWDPGTPIETDLTAGAHTLTIRAREPGSMIDALAVTADPSWHPHAGGAGPVLRLEAEAAETILAPMVARDEPGTPQELQVRWLYPPDLALERDVYRGRDGSADGGFLRDHPRLRAQARTTDPVFVTLLVPRGDGTGGPAPGAWAEVTARRARVTVMWRGSVDSIDLALNGETSPVFVRGP